MKRYMAILVAIFIMAGLTSQAAAAGRFDMGFREALQAAICCLDDDEIGSLQQPVVIEGVNYEFARVWRADADHAFATVFGTPADVLMFKARRQNQIPRVVVMFVWEGKYNLWWFRDDLPLNYIQILEKYVDENFR